MPTPVSALIHAATLVTAGIYLMVRLGPFMAGSDLVILVGCLTAFMAGVFGFFQADLKRVIAFSTCSQLGYKSTKNAPIILSKNKNFKLFSFNFTKANSLSNYRFYSSRFLDSQEIDKNKVPVNYVEKMDITSREQQYYFKTNYKNKAGIYLWQNQLNGKCYIGSSLNMSARLSNYFDLYYLNNVKDKMPICAALLLYGFANFNLYVLEVLQAPSKNE